MAQREQLVAGRYRLLAPLGRGGMGTVWRAHDETLDREVAVKEVVSPPDLSDEERQESYARTRREARSAARLNQSSIVTIHDVVDDGGHPWIVMELVSGRTLHDAVRDDGPLPPARVAEIGLRLVDALAAAHAGGVVHRDLKPANVLLSADGRVVLTDFGIASIAGGETLTSTGALLGTPEHMAPERFESGPAAPAADLWSLGTTLFTALEGRSPFRRDTLTATVAAVIGGALPAHRADGPLAAALTGLLTRDPRQRITAAAVRPLLARAASAAATAPVAPAPDLRPEAPREAAPTGPRPPLHPTGPQPLYPPRPTAPVHPPAQRGDRVTRTAVGLAIAAAAIAAVVVVAAALSWPPGPESPTGSVDPAAAEGAQDGGPTGGQTDAGSDTDDDAGTDDGQETGETGDGEPAGSGGTAEEPPEGYVLHEDPSGFGIVVPEGWEPRYEGASVYFESPDGPAYLQVDQTEHPTSDEMAHTEQAHADTASSGRLEGYRLVEIRPVDYPGGSAADWEFTWTDDDGPRHVHVRNITTGGGSPYAVLLSVPEAEWDSHAGMLSMAMDSFQPAG